MQSVEIGPWVIDLDLDATRNYYQSQPHADDQIARNYRAFCSQLTHAEQSFFDSLGIDSMGACDISGLGVTRAKTIFTFGKFNLIGVYIAMPPQFVWSVDDLVEHEFEDDRPDDRVTIGRFVFEFNRGDDKFMGTPVFPEGFAGPGIQIEFNIEEVPWLLDEKCETTFYEPPKWWQFNRHIKEWVQNKKDDADYKDQVRQEAKALFQVNAISFMEMTSNEVNQYMQHWFKAFVPPEKQKEGRKHCFNTRRYRNLLWHAFSYGDTPCLEGEGSKSAFQELLRGTAVFLLNDQKIAFRIEQADKLSAAMLDGFGDVLLTDADFKWTYAHTHEDHCGPYLHVVGVDYPPRPADPIEEYRSLVKGVWFGVFEDENGGYVLACMRRQDDVTSQEEWLAVPDEGLSYETVEKAADAARRILGIE